MYQTIPQGEMEKLSKKQKFSKKLGSSTLIRFEIE